MLHPSYTELISAVNSGVAEGEEPVVNSRYSIVIAAAKRARQLIAGEEPLVKADDKKKPLSIAVDELYSGEVKILPEDENSQEQSVEETAGVEAFEDEEDSEGEDSEEEETDEEEETGDANQ